MSSQITLSRNVPDHIAPELVFEFDIYGDQRIGRDVQGDYQRTLEDAPAIFWTPLNGGHWIVKSFDAISSVVTNPVHFSVREMQIPRVENPPFFIPLSLDPPENLPYRRAMQPMFGPTAVKVLEPRIREWAAKFVDAAAAQPVFDFMEDVSKVYPVSVFMELMGMDLTRLPEMRDLADEFFWNNNDSDKVAEISGRILAMLGELVAEKRAHPDDRLLSHFIQVDIGGRTMSDDEILAMSFVLFLGGMDTVTNVTGFAFQQLAQMPEMQMRLAQHPEDIPAFADEAVRMFGVVNTPRLVIADIDIGPARFREGEMVLCILSLGSRDPSRIENPNLLDIDRKKIAHLTFSSGPHLCIGHVLGRTELRILVEEWFKRIPTFRLAESEPHRFRLGTVMALENLPLAQATAK